jgi:hypothetical protein
MAVAVFMHESIAAPDLYVKRIMGHYTRLYSGHFEGQKSGEG